MRVLSLRFLIIFVAAVLAIDAQTIQSEAASGGGIYVINAVTNKNTILAAVKADQNIDGIVYQVAWNAIEPSEGTFNWSSIDTVMAQAQAASMHVSLAVMPGYQTPTWVYSDGAQQFQFLWDIASWGPKLCSVQSLPVPWDPIYLAKWNSMVAALGGRYGSNPTLASVKVTGVNSKTGEIFLPTDINLSISSGSVSCKSYNDLTNWQKAGYTRLKVESAWNDIMQMFVQAFPETKLEAMLVPEGFPAIDDNGNIFPALLNQDNEVTGDIITSGVSEYASQFSIQNDGWSSTWTWKVANTYAGRVMTGTQENHPQGSLTSQAIKTALAAGIKYIELYPTDATASSAQAELAAAHQVLQ